MNAFIGLKQENFALLLAQSGVFSGLSMSMWSLGNIWLASHGKQTRPLQSVSSLSCMSYLIWASHLPV